MIERYRVVRGEGAVVTVALHAGHAVRENLIDHFALSEAERLYEEDPGTNQFASIAHTSIVSHFSRFEHDLNRSREKAVYRIPEDAWGLTVWKGSLPPDRVEESLAFYDEFYKIVEELLRAKLAECRRVLLLDMHSYNHCRDRAQQGADPAANPTIEINTTSSGRERWSDEIELFIGTLQREVYDGRQLDVRENVRFPGPGHFARWVNERFSDSVCVISVEVKKVYMDEWTGELYGPVVRSFQSMLARGVLALQQRYFPV